eukprot:TRINITY_DN5869_c1_g1_i1.p1 TRINITY_DN5869_c1_g1~~TRINITY_DN5869_c1_g1_i1.p1  ORF type:complete len:115 (-),score=47.12 TRINITY_DN5869_c1_g1_i1:171-476(-)
MSARKEAILNLDKYIDKKINVKFSGGREVEGVLKGWDTMANMVLDDCEEYLRDIDDPSKVTSEKRKLGLVVCRGPALMLIHPLDGTDEIANPFNTQEQSVI